MRPPEDETREAIGKPSLVIAADSQRSPDHGPPKPPGHLRLLEDEETGAAPPPDQAILLARLGALRQEHSDLDAAIAALAAAPHFDGLMAARLKKKKLRLKDMIEALKDQLTPDIIA